MPLNHWSIANQSWFQHWLCNGSGQFTQKRCHNIIILISPYVLPRIESLYSTTPMTPCVWYPYMYIPASNHFIQPQWCPNTSHMTPCGAHPHISHIIPYGTHKISLSPIYNKKALPLWTSESMIIKTSSILKNLKINTTATVGHCSSDWNGLFIRKAHHRWSHFARAYSRSGMRRRQVRYCASAT